VNVDRRANGNLNPCYNCSLFLVETGFAPHCYGCDHEIARRACLIDPSPVLMVKVPPSRPRAAVASAKL